MDHQDNITESDLDRMLFDETTEPRALPFSLLQRITNGFSNEMEIGRGGFAVVYKGMLENGAVAIKRLSNTYMYEEEFFREVDSLMKAKHKNIIRFLGYCSDTQGNMTKHEGKFVMADIQQRLLCFEYMPNGGLDDFIKDPYCRFNWRDRFEIIKGICEGVHHLHLINIVHLDLKPANILFDENLEPKITDFGISRSFEEDQTWVTATKVVGTMGYMAPEFLGHVITQKYDLYSLGVIIMEILTGKKGCQDVDNVVTNWNVRLGISEGTSLSEQIRVCAKIGMECLEFDPANRPASVKHVIERLAETERAEDCSRRFKILDMGITSSDRIIYSLDTNQSKQWIITGGDRGRVRIYNYKTQKKVYSFKLSDEHPVMCVKFIERKQWFAAALHTYHFRIHVYSYATNMQHIKSLTSANGRAIMSLTIHPTKPYLVLMRYGTLTYFNWDKNWKDLFVTPNSSISVKEGHCVTFSSKGIMACALDDCTVKVWISIESTLKATYHTSSYILSGHSGRVNCLVFFTRGDQENLATGSNDLTCKIWDMQKKICLYTLYSKSPVMSILYQPDLKILITGTEDGHVHSWRTACFRPMETVNVGGGAVHSLACFMGRVVIGKEDEVAILDYVDYGVKSMDIKQDAEETSKVAAGSSSKVPILDVHWLKLCFSCEPNMSMPGSLQLTNNTDERVAFRLIDKSGKSGQFLTKLEQYGNMLPKSSYTWVVTTEEDMKLAEETVVQTRVSGDRYLVPFTSQSECDIFFDEAVEMGNTVYDVIAIQAPQGDTISEPTSPVSKGMKITSVTSIDEELCSIYAHPTERWILTGHSNGDLRTWNQESKKPMSSFKVSEQPVCVLKFIGIEKWIVAGTSDGSIHLFDYVHVTEMRKVTTFRCKTKPQSSLYSLAVHPFKSYILSTTMEHWKYEKKVWTQIQDFSWSRKRVNQVAFNPSSDGYFAGYIATAGEDGSIEYWINTRALSPELTLLGHSKAVNCIEYFKSLNKHYLISGSDDCTAKIWEANYYCSSCIRTLAIMSPVISVLALADRPCLVTGSKRGTVQFWNSTDFRLERTVHCGGGGPVRGLVCSMGSQRVVIGQDKTIIILDFDKDADASHDEDATASHESAEKIKRGRWWHRYTKN